MQCVQNRPGPPHIKFLPKQPLPRPPAHTWPLHSRPRPGSGWARPWPDLFQTTFPGPECTSLFTHTRCTPSCSAAHPLPPSAQIIYNAFKAGPALPKPALPHPFNNVNRENRTNGSLCLVCSHVSQDLAFPVAKTNF